METDQERERATAAYHAVLFSPDLSPELFPSLDRASKVALRCVNKAMRSQVDASIKVVASPVSGTSPDALIAALVRWPGMHDLTLFAVRSADDLAPLATASLAGLTSLTMRQPTDEAFVIETLALSGSAAATVQVIDVSGCYSLSSIDFVRSCMQLRCLWMPGCEGVSDLSPLAACSETLEELWTAGNEQVVSLAPLKACTKLRKLDLRGCSFDSDEVEDLRLACTQLADPVSVQLEGLVHDLQLNMSADSQEAALGSLTDMIDDEDGGCEAQTAIAACGIIPALVQLLLEPESSADVQEAAAGTLGWLADGHSRNQTACATAGAIPALVQLLGSVSGARVQTAAAGALGILACDHFRNQAYVSDAGAIAALVQLMLEPASSEDAQTAAARALGCLAKDYPSNQASIAGAAAIPALVRLLGPGSSEDGSFWRHTAAAETLGILADDHARNQAAISAAGAIPALVKLLDHSRGPVNAAMAAAGALRNLPDYSDALPVFGMTARRS
ncbi:hypothetical protein FOA52_006388 [Chlamydomonas sp. UWO 241]|nr:hypothetical protein FOA52_006388 [Chlamydomonas sp. UWO 241]